MRRKNKHRAASKKAVQVTQKETPTAEQSSVVIPSIVGKEEPQPPYAWSASLRGRRFATSVGVLGLIAIVIYGLTYIVFGPLGMAVASTILGVVGGRVINTIEVEQGANYEFATPWSPRSWLGVIFLAVIIFQVIDLLVRLWLLPWRLAYGPSFNTSPAAITGVIVCDLSGLILSGVLIGYLMPTRALSAAIVGASLYTGMGLVEAYTGVATYASYAFIASYLDVDPSPEDYEDFRLGLVCGLVIRGLVVVLIARYVAKRRIRKGQVYR
jgi:hypothetical protein